MAETRGRPAVNQVQVHPYYSQPDLRAANQKLGILTQYWSPIGGAYTYRGNERNPALGPCNRGFGAEVFQDGSPGHTSLASRPRIFRLPQVREAGAHRRELRRLRLLPCHRGARLDRFARYGRPRRPRSGIPRPGDLWLRHPD
jgi:hypothetical protein